MRFYGSFLVIFTMLLVGLALLILYMFTYFPRQFFWVGAIFLGFGLFLFMSSFHEFCHLVAILATQNQDKVRGLSLSYKVLSIEFEDHVPSKDAAMIYLSSLLTVPVTFSAVYWTFQKYLQTLLFPIELASRFSLAIAFLSLPFTLAMSRHDISDWRHSRN